MKTQIIAHRGASKYAPENTMPAFQLAYEMKADGIELDVHLTKDDIPVIIHDERIDRTTNGKGFVRDYTFNELEQLDAGTWFSNKYTGTTIPSLDELLQWIHQKPLALNIELKNNKYDYPHLETIVYKMIADYQLINRTCFSSFNSTSIERMRKINDQGEIALLTSKKRNDLIDYAESLGANAVHVSQHLIKPRLVKYAHQHAMPIRAYTVNKPISLIRMRQIKIDGIITDVPDIARKYVSLFKRREKK